MENFEDEKYIKLLAESLWSGTATAMVGAGFSLNARPCSPKTKPMASWSGLIGDMKEELGLTDAEKDNYDALNTAELYKATFGRSQLEHFLESHLPDREYEPGTLHKDFVNLPWADIFTTNYDTLLERAMDTLSRPYHHIIAIKDIPGAQRPRLVKLHGSFGAERPLIFTATDYRRYPVKNAPFVNMVQEAIMENSLCLIGFSGDDPNFRQWIGWVHDNLGHYRGNIYLCGVLNLTFGKRKLLESLGVTPIDLYPLVKDEDYDQRHAKGLEKFFSLLREYRPQDPWDWEVEEKSFTELEQSYPGWLIAPRSIREKLRDKVWKEGRKERRERKQSNRPNFYTLLEKIKKGETLPSSDEVSNEKVLHEIHDILWEKDIAIEFFKQKELKIIGNWLGKYVPKYKKSEWLECMLFLIKQSAICNYKKEFNQWESMADVYIKEYPQYIGQWYYWKCRMLLRCLNFKECREVVEKWPEAGYDAYESIWRASIYSELGEYGIASRIVKEALAEIRSRLLTSPNDIALLSREGWALYFQEKLDFSIGEKYSFSDSSIKRFNYLHTFLCDPCTEIEYLSREMCAGREQYLNKTYAYDPDIITHHLNFLNQNKNDNISIESILYLLWESGLPLRINSSVILQKELERYFSQNYDIRDINCQQVLYFIMFSGNDTLLKLLFTRFFVASLSDESMIELKSMIVSAWVYFMKFQPQRDNEIYLINWQSSTTEILSRILIRMDYNELSNIASNLQSLVKENDFNTRQWILDLRKRLSYCLPEDDTYQSFLRDKQKILGKNSNSSDKDEDISTIRKQILEKDFADFKKYGNQLYSTDMASEIEDYLACCYRYIKPRFSEIKSTEKECIEWSIEDASILFRQLKQICQHFIDIPFDIFHSRDIILKNTLIIMKRDVLSYLLCAEEDKKKDIILEVYELRKRHSNMEFYFDTLWPYITAMDQEQSTEAMCVLVQDLWSANEECSAAALYCIEDWIVESQEKRIAIECPTVLRKELFYKVMSGQESALETAIDVLNDLLQSYPDYMVSNGEEDLLINGMSHLYRYTDFDHIRENIIEDDPREYEKYPHYQKALSKLAATLYVRYKNKKQGGTVPAILEKWKERSQKSCLPEVKRTFDNI
ncbi:SIR2 family NAD-dependent protein deacylase [Mitsuokella multacida]|uniref:SIR2 family NAD-dependent protein deacylase n=1 Tax=Mitsuokella multacida TaxID=52226 RepID=UPI0024305DF0|nr:SIR2 family protein [Mitsuokella multacida]